jgi:flagellar hook-length control protein FliK
MNTSIPDILPKQSSSTPASQPTAAPPATGAGGFSKQLGKAQAKSRKSMPANTSRLAKSEKSGQKSIAPAPVKPKPVVDETEPAQTTEAAEDQAPPQQTGQSQAKPKGADETVEAQSKQTDHSQTPCQLSDAMTAIDDQSDQEPSGEHSPEKAKPQEPDDQSTSDVAAVVAPPGSLPSAIESTPTTAPVKGQNPTQAAGKVTKPNVSPFEPSNAAQATDDEDDAAAQTDGADEVSVADAKNQAVAKAEPAPTAGNPAAVDAAAPKATTITQPVQIAPATAPTPDAQFTQTNHPQIVTAIHGQLLPSGGTMNIRLDPPGLGAMQITVKVEGGIVSASFETSNDEATRLLSHTLGELKGALESQGVSVDRLHVQQSSKPQEHGESGGDDKGRQPGGSNPQSAQQEHQRREMLRRMWRRAGYGRDPLDLVA